MGNPSVNIFGFTFTHCRQVKSYPLALFQEQPHFMAGRLICADFLYK